MIGFALIVAGYAWLLWQFGWMGLAAGLVHVAAMLAASWRKKRK